MTKAEFAEIVKTILEKEEIDLTSLANNCKIGRSFLSTLVNTGGSKTLKGKTASKVRERYPAYFAETGQTKDTGQLGAPRRDPRDQELIVLYKERIAELQKQVNLNDVLRRLEDISTRLGGLHHFSEEKDFRAPSLKGKRQGESGKSGTGTSSGKGK